MRVNIISRQIISSDCFKSWTERITDRVKLRQTILNGDTYSVVSRSLYCMITSVRPPQLPYRISTFALPVKSNIFIVIEPDDKQISAADCNPPKHTCHGHLKCTPRHVTCVKITVNRTRDNHIGPSRPRSGFTRPVRTPDLNRFDFPRTVS